MEPLEQNGGPLGDIPFDMPSPQIRPYDWRGNEDDGYESVDSMPGLQSVFNSSDDEVEELSNEDSGEDEDLSRGAMRLGDRTALAASHAVEPIQSIEQFSGSLGSRVERAEEPVERDGDVTESDTPVLAEEPRLEPPFITDGRGRVVWTSPAEEDKTSRPAEEENGEEDGDVTESDTPVLETSSEEPRLEPPFITDGRGRVVWTSPAEEDKTSRPAEEENGEPASRPESVTGSGGLLGWFNALF